MLFDSENLEYYTKYWKIRDTEPASSAFCLCVMGLVRLTGLPRVDVCETGRQTPARALLKRVTAEPCDADFSGGFGREKLINLPPQACRPRVPKAIRQDRRLLAALVRSQGALRALFSGALAGGGARR